MDEAGVFGAVLETHLAIASRNGKDSMSPTCRRSLPAPRRPPPPVTDMALISSVMCGMTCTVARRDNRAPLLVDHRLVDLPGGEIVALAHAGLEKRS